MAHTNTVYTLQAHAHTCLACTETTQSDFKWSSTKTHTVHIGVSPYNRAFYNSTTSEPMPLPCYLADALPRLLRSIYVLHALTALHADPKQ